MATLRIKAATIEDAKKLIPNIRAADVRELRDAYDISVETGLLMPILRKEIVDIMSNGSVPLGIFGISKTNSQSAEKIGIAWFVSTQSLFDIYPREFLSLSKQWLDNNSVGYTLLRNYVSVENTVHLRWVTYLGFKLVERIESFGVSGKPFWKIEKRIGYPMLNK